MRIPKIKTTRIVALLLTPFVAFGLYAILSQRFAKETHAVDPLLISYNSSGPPSPIFIVENMLPGEEVEKEFNAKNQTDSDFDLLLRGIVTTETQEFADILEIIIVDEDGNNFYGGSLGTKTLQDFFDAGNVNLGPIPANADKSFRVKVKFPSFAGNEYQGAKVIFNLEFSTSAVSIDLPPECANLEGLIEAVIEGTEGDDKINGTHKNELILGFGGHDNIDGRSGHDCIVGGDGNDKLDGGSGNDVAVGGNGLDEIDGGAGKDLLYGNEDADKIEGGGDDDKIFGGEGNDNLEGGGAQDEVYGGGGNDNIEGGGGNDKLWGESGNDFVYGGGGGDYLDGGDDNDNLDGDGGTDQCINGETLASCEL